MDDLKMQKQTLKKAYKKTKRKHITPWKILAIICAVVMIVSIPLTILLQKFDNTMAARFGGSFWKLQNEDANAQYYTSDFNSAEEMVNYGLALTQQVEAEGAALLMNNNNALPLAADAKVSTFSSSSVNLVYGGTGSGNIDASTADTLRTALEKVGVTVNPTLWDFYTVGAGKDYARSKSGMVAKSSEVTAEVPWDVYTDEVKDSVAQYGDAAIVTLSRVGGEGADLSYGEVNYLALDENEKAMLQNVAEMKKNGTVKKTILLINSANALQVDFLKNNEYDIDAALWIGDVGISGINAVAEILTGKVNPSGSLVDTYCYDNFSAPAMWNFTPTTYEGYVEGGDVSAKAKSYMIYQEGIYVGYKYYETRYEDFVTGNGNAGDYAYGDIVAYPFGYGMSYTNFDISDMNVSYNAADDTYTVTVKVTNTGDMAGKKTVQVYVQSPYTDYDKENGVEKSAVSLVGFGKTGMIEPGASETLSMTVNKRDIASYDTYGAGTYILDAGDYYFTAATDAHNAVNNILAAKGYTVESTNGKMTADGNADLTYTWTEDALNTTTYATSENGTAITNQLSRAAPNLYEGIEETVTWLSRSDWNGTLPTETVKLALTELLKKDLKDIRYDPADYESVDMPTLGAKNGVKLYDMIGLDYNDPKWDELLDQMTFDEMNSLIGDAFHWTMPVKSVEAPGTRDENGPQGLTASLLGNDKSQLTATAFTSEDVMAATFNTEIMTEIGKVIGNNCLEADIACLYGPGNNIHRTPYGGRNFEYYSEDGFLSGMMSAYEVKAIQDKGVHVVMKHFALNDCEQDRIGLGVWLNEQAAREVYLKAFQAPVEVGNANGVMIAYTRWGAVWSGGNYGLVTGILRNEWGCDGMVITDNVLTQYVNGPDGVLAGVSIYDAMMSFVTDTLPKYKNDPVIVTAMREACHHNLYAIANSCGMNGVGADTTIKVTRPTVVTMSIIIACASTFFCLLGIVMWIIGGIKFRKTEEYKAYKDFKKSLKAAKKA
uniref:glycoside hydrolase family 3 C-terminal domain-containing protein n=1 Tax=Gemmiger formicilis TaxID=745368 RepID=UPI003FED42A0